MSTPPPFGDPSAVQRENASALGKGIAMGCGGCLALLAVPAALVLLFFGIVYSSLRFSQPCQDALRAARASSELRQEIGEPIQLGWQVNGSLNSSNGRSRADFNMTVEGPRGAADVHVQGSSSGEGWTYETLTASPSGSDRVIHLHVPSGAP